MRCTIHTPHFPAAENEEPVPRGIRHVGVEQVLRRRSSKDVGRRAG